MVLIKLHRSLSLLATLGFAADNVLYIHLIPAGLVPVFESDNNLLDRVRQHSLKNKPDPNA